MFSQSNIKSLLRVEVMITPEGIGEGRCRVAIFQRVKDGGDNQTRWDRIGNISAGRGAWEQLEAILLLGSNEAGIEIEWSVERMAIAEESNWARARREAQEGAVKMAKKMGVEL